ncbi:MAG TPA: L-threonylcarbamoyladenylate synthase [Polyangiaceae bacterium]|nr:L-threonylcarbamoyladenylate synthase [Polyangiaceae bacterium]
MAVVPASVDSIRRAAEILRRGGLVAFPTETVYGLGADALAPAACARIFEVKRRPRFDPLIVHVGDVAALDAVCDFRDARAQRLAAAFWPGPLTLVVPKTAALHDIVTSGLPTVAVRVPEHPVARALLAESRTPIAAPSANPFGYISPTLAIHVERQLGSAVELVLDGGACTLGVESTIVDVSGEHATLLRPGALATERIEALIGELRRPEHSATPRAPGQLPSHYAPRTPLFVVEPGGFDVRAGERAGLLAFAEPDGALAARCAVVEVLSRARDPNEAAVNLFAALHRLDGALLDVIYAERVPSAGLGAAIHDRLERAAAARKS